MLWTSPSLRSSDQTEEHLRDAEQIKKMQEQYLIPLIKHDGGSVMVWGALEVWEGPWERKAITKFCNAMQYPVDSP